MEILRLRHKIPEVARNILRRKTPEQIYAEHYSPTAKNIEWFIKLTRKKIKTSDFLYNREGSAVFINIDPQEEIPETIITVRDSSKEIKFISDEKSHKITIKRRQLFGDTKEHVIALIRRFGGSSANFHTIDNPHRPLVDPDGFEMITSTPDKNLQRERRRFYKQEITEAFKTAHGLLQNTLTAPQHPMH